MNRSCIAFSGPCPPIIPSSHPPAPRHFPRLSQSKHISPSLPPSPCFIMMSPTFSESQLRTHPIHTLQSPACEDPRPDYPWSPVSVPALRFASIHLQVPAPPASGARVRCTHFPISPSDCLEENFFPVLQRAASVQQLDSSVLQATFSPLNSTLHLNLLV